MTVLIVAVSVWAMIVAGMFVYVFVKSSSTEKRLIEVAQASRDHANIISLFHSEYAAFSSSTVAAIEESRHRGDEINKRLVDLETENRVPVKTKADDEDDDPFTGGRSWLSQQTRAERASGVRN